MAQDQAACIGDLIVEELAEVLLIHLALLGIDYCGEAVQFHVMGMDILDCTNDIAQLAHAGRFDQDAIRVVLFQHLFQSLAKVAYQTTADTAGVHLGDLYAGVLQKAAVNTDLAEFVFDEHQLFANIAFLNQFLDQRGFTGTQKAGEYCNFCHFYLHFFLSISTAGSIFSLRLHNISIAQFFRRCKGFSGSLHGIFMNAEEHVPSETVSPENAKGRFSPSPAWFQEYGTFSAKDVQIWELPFDCHFRLFRYSC